MSQEFTSRYGVTGTHFDFTDFNRSRSNTKIIVSLHMDLFPTIEAMESKISLTPANQLCVDFISPLSHLSLCLHRTGSILALTLFF